MAKIHKSDSISVSITLLNKVNSIGLLYSFVGYSCFGNLLPVCLSSRHQFDDNGKDVGLITNPCFWTKLCFSPPLLLLLAVETMVVLLLAHMNIKL